MSNDQTPAAEHGSELTGRLSQDEAEVGGTCNVCGGGLRYGERHRKCGDAVMATVAAKTRSQKLADAGFTRRPGLWALQAREVLELIAAPREADGSWKFDREACRQMAAEALGRYDDEKGTLNP